MSAESLRPHRCWPKVTTTTKPETTPLLRDRWSASSYDPDHEIDQAELAALLQAAQWAPSAGNSQPWSFIVARRGDPTHDVLVSHLSRGNVGWVPRASVVLITVAQVGTGEEADAPSFSDYAEYDLGQAVAHVCVQARALGLDSHQFAGFDHAAVARELGVPGHFKVMTGIAIGRHVEPVGDEGLQAREARLRTRKALSDVAYAGRWGRPWA